MAKFCSYCGKPIDESGECNCGGASRKTTEKIPSAMIKKYAIPAIIVLLIVIVLAVFIGYRSMIVDLGDYIVIKDAEGLNGQGTVVVSLDRKALYTKVFGKDSLSNDSVMNDEEFYNAIKKEVELEEQFSRLMSCIELQVNKTEGLCNGDTVEVTVVFRNPNNYRFTNIFNDGSATYIISELREGKEINPWEDGVVTIDFSGFDGYGEAIVSIKEPSGLEEYLEYHVLNATNLSNGDVVTVSVSFNKDRLEAAGYLYPLVTEQTYTVSDLKAPEPLDLFAPDILTLSFEGFSGVGIVNIEVNKPEGTNHYLSYDIAEDRNISNGDTVTVVVTADVENMRRIGYDVPAVSEHTFTVSNLPVLFVPTDVFPLEAFKICADLATQYIEAEVNNPGNNVTLASGPEYVTGYFIYAKDVKNPHKDTMKGLKFYNALCVVEKYTLKFFGSTERTYWVVYLFEDFYESNGVLLYSIEEKESMTNNTAKSFEEFESWFNEKFSNMEIIQIP